MIERSLRISMAGATLLLASAAHAGDVGRWHQAIRENTIGTPAYTTNKCLLPYPICKATFAAVSLIASWEQLVMGGDVEGAQHTIGRGFGGQWVVTPKDVSGDPLWSLPEPIPLSVYIVSGRGNTGTEAIDPFPRPERQTDDILPP